MATDTGYLLNIAIPWAEIYPKKRIAKSGDKIGINIIVTDVDSDEKGSKELFWTQENKSLPQIELKNL